VGLKWAANTGGVTTISGTSPINVSAGANPVVTIDASSTTASGAVQLYDGVNSTSTSLALTAAQGKVLQDQITSLAVSGTVELAGTIDASTGNVVSVTSVGSADGYTVGSALPAASSTTNNTYVIVTTPGTMTPPGGSATVATRGDWFLVSEITPGVYSWTFLNVGFDAPAATTSLAGIVCLSTNALAQAGTDATTALTPAAAASAYISKACITAKGTLVSGSAADTPTALAVGTDNQILVACAAASSGLCWTNPPAVVPAIPCACITAKGDLIAGASANNPVPLSVGTNGQVLVACSTAASGLCWVTGPVILPATPTVAGIVLGCTTATNTAIGCNALLANTGPGNVAVGVCALASNTTSDRNTAVGDCALRLNTIGVNNIAVGALSMFNNTTGGFNVSVGRNAMSSNTTGCFNVAIGYNAACSSTTAVYNVAVGDQALNQNTILGANTAVGACAMCSFNSGTIGANDAFGANALCQFTSGAYNVSLGAWSLFSFASGCNNTAVGHRAMSGPTGGSNNTALGFYAGFNLTTGSNNVAIGCGASVCNPSGSCQLAIGFANGQNWLTGDSNKNIRPGNGIIDCIGSVGTAGQILKTTGTGALQWSSVGAMSSGFVNDVGTAGQWIEIDGIQFGMWTGCRSFVMRPAAGTMTASWGTCYQGGGVGFAATNFQDIAIASPNWRFIFLNANFPSHATVQQATICVAPSGGFTRAMYQFCGIVGASYLGNGISVTRIA
jgi:hypothetical protein